MVDDLSLLVDKTTPENTQIVRLDVYREAVAHAQLQLAAGWTKSEICIDKLYKEFINHERSNPLLYKETE